ncbi:MAG: hypothetical protein GEV10_21880 [Streptosporangiales bacterium]|nr:hypothetical protein [Streptosporangiales bacterium]
MGLMNEPRWRRLVGGLVYSVQFERDLDDDLAEHQALAMLEEPMRGFGQEDGYAALGEALRSGDDLTDLLPGPIPADHTDQDIRDFVARVRDRMDARRPWVTPAFVPLDASRSDEFRTGRAVAALPRRYVEVGERLQRMFTTIEGTDGGEREVLLLRLRTGDEVALVAPWWERSERVAVVQHPGSTRSPHEVLTAFLDLTGYDRHEITDLTVDRS